MQRCDSIKAGAKMSTVNQLQGWCNDAPVSILTQRCIFVSAFGVMQQWINVYPDTKMNLYVIFQVNVTVRPCLAWYKDELNNIFQVNATTMRKCLYRCNRHILWLSSDAQITLLMRRYIFTFCVVQVNATMHNCLYRSNDASLHFIPC